MRLIERRSRRRFRFSCAMIPSVGNPFEELDPTDFGSNGSALPAETGTAGLVGPMAGRHIPEVGQGSAPPTAAAPALIGDAIAEGR